jgi:ABC-2 type transport system ATP-binding protein
MIEIRNVTKTFDKVTASNHLNMELDTGIYGLVGENGAGKSTLLRLIANVIKQDEGEILIDGKPNDTKEAKEKIFFLSDDPYVKPYQTIPSILSFYKSFYDIDVEKFERIINSCNLSKSRRVSTFSKGMKRQLFIAIALSIRCRYLFMDEAFDGLDPLIMSKIKDYILALKEEGKCVVIASHNINTLNQIADRVLLLCKGTLSRNGSVEDMAYELRKYQIAATTPLTMDKIQNLGYDVVSFKKIGSIYHIVLKSDDTFPEKCEKEYHPMILEEIPLDPEEIMMLNMMMAKKEVEAHE